jgi:two-component system sensor histidine kinase BaeS
MRTKLFLSFALVVLVSVIGVVVITRLTTAQDVRSFMFQGGMTGVQDLVLRLQDYYHTNGSWQGVQDILILTGHGNGRGSGMGQGMMNAMMNQRLRLADANGNLLVDTENPQASGQLSQSDLSDSIALQDAGRTIGYLLPEGGIAFSPGSQTNLLNRLNRSAIIAGLLAGGLSLILALLLSFGLNRPVQELTRASRGLALGNLSRRVPVHGDDELATLGRSFNQMAESLQKAEETRRAMTADIAHELRTPLAVQRAHLEAIQDGVYPLTVENLVPILEQNYLLTRLVEDLRTLALAEAGQLTLERRPTDFIELVQRAVEHFTPQASAHQVALSFTSPAGLSEKLILSLDPVRVDQILGNLLTNALRYTPAAGQISLTVSKEAGQVRLAVQDSGLGIPEESLPHIFERFYRADPSRSRSEGGSGLGLSIARQLAQAHGGGLSAENAKEGGALFILSLPYDPLAQGLKA